MKTIEIQGIHLHRRGGESGPAKVVVSVQILGRWVDVIEEPVDGNFSHIVEPSGIYAAARGPEDAKRD